MKIAFITFDQMTSLDLIGFYDPVTRLKSMNIISDIEWQFCSNKQQITDDRGLTILADSISKPLGNFDMLFIPGGLGTRKLQHDTKFIEWLSSSYSVKLKISVCTGSLLLGAAGFLRNRLATTHPSALRELEPYCQEIKTDRIVDQGDIITAGGVSTSIDLGLYVVQRLAGTAATKRVAKQMDYPYRREPKTRWDLLCR